MGQSVRMAEQAGILPSMMSSKAWREAFQVVRPKTRGRLQEEGGRERGEVAGENGGTEPEQGGGGRGEYSCDFEDFLMGIAKASSLIFRQVKHQRSSYQHHPLLTSTHQHRPGP